MKKNKKILLMLVTMVALLGVAYVFYITKIAQPAVVVAPQTITEIEQRLSQETGVSNITISHNKKMLVYNKQADNKVTSYLWRINELGAMELLNFTGQYVAFAYSKHDKNLIISEQIGNEVRSHLVNTITGQVSEKQLVTLNTPMWSPTENIFAVLTQNESEMFLKIFYSDFKEFQTVTKTAANQSYQLLSWDQNNNISYLVINKDSSITRSYNYSRKIHKILGDSNKLSPNSWQSMLNWRCVTVAKARYNAKDLFINGESEKKKIAITFDDGPDKKNTAKILDILKKYNVKASFFVVGDKAEKHPELVKRMYNENHLVLNHSYNHANYEYKTAEQIKTDILKTQDIISNIIAVKPLLIRTPYGVVNDKIFNVTRDINHKIILWSIDSLDWSQKEADNIIKNTLNNARSGDIILLHSVSFTTETVKALPTIIEKLTEQGFSLVDVAELLNVKAYQ